MRERLFIADLIFVVFLIVPGGALSQTTQPSATLTVNGHSGEAPVIQAGGRSYVDVETLARITNGSIRFNGNQILLTLPAPARGARMTVPPTRQAGAAPAAPATPAGFSKGFLKAGIEAMAEIREWRSALESAVQYGFPPGDNWINRYSGAAATAISHASAAASTDDDRQGFQLLHNEFNNMQSLSNQMLSRRKSMNYIPPNALQNDPTDQKILACARALGEMAAAGQFQDAAACH
jgi:hypothetical protein